MPGAWIREGCRRFPQRGMAVQYDPYKGSKTEMQRSYNDSLSSKANSSQWEKQQTEKTSHLEKVPFSEGQSQSQSGRSHWQQEQGRHLISPIFQHPNCLGLGCLASLGSIQEQWEKSDPLNMAVPQRPKAVICSTRVLALAQVPVLFWSSCSPCSDNWFEFPFPYITSANEDHLARGSI